MKPINSAIMRLRPRSAALVLAALGYSCVAQSSPNFVDVSATHLPELPKECMDTAVGDIDGDGDLDIAMAIEHTRNALLLNDGTGKFTDVSYRLPVTHRDDHEDAEFADFDGDGDLDLVVVTEHTTINELLLNDGTGRFANKNYRLKVWGDSNAVVITDLNGDGAPDMVIGNNEEELVAINNGDAYFSDQTVRYWPDNNMDRTQDLELVDLDGDGDLDIAAANEGRNRLFFFENGRFIDRTEGRLPERLAETREVRAADFDGDGDADLLFTNIKLEGGIGEDVDKWTRRDSLMLNNGKGVFTEVDQKRFPDGNRDHFTSAAVDLDADGDLDVLLPGSIWQGEKGYHYRALINDGKANFKVAKRGSVLPDIDRRGIGFDIAVADFNGDGREDLFLCNRNYPIGYGGEELYEFEGGLHNLLFQKAP